MQKLLKSYGIQHQTSVAYTSQQNGCVEREMRTVAESARTMLLESGLNKNLWAEAINTAVYVINRTGPSRVKDKTPYELWRIKDFDVNNLQVFGSQVSVHVPDQKRLKFDSKAELGNFVGYGENTKGYRIYFRERNVIEIKRDIVFIKQSIENKERERKQEKEYHINFDNQEEVEQVSEGEESQYEDTENPDTIESENEQDSIHSFHEQSILEEEIEEEQENSQETSEQTEEVTERPRRAKKQPSWLKDYVQGEENIFLSYCCDEPVTYQEAMKRPDKSKWEETINKELKTMEENNTWEKVTEVPDGENIVSSKWVFKVKDADGKALYKARLVARGFEQKNCDDQIYSPVAKLTTFKALMAVATQKRQPVYQMDVTGAFLYGDIIIICLAFSQLYWGRLQSSRI
ncbi:hypothetical protein PYW07_006600 [Mythimna separata]|uniref:Integrase catalytic domain-containing protein n=1 Tax=Mythimna separata TaxID=271217 RepID=A0AAD7YWC9_MYTSE|nr:hypothetical protein PYW07_006600 [Mythimna separata]